MNMESTGAADAQNTLLIIGSGLAGYTVAREFRKLDSQAPIVMITQDKGGFYSKPMLSNALAMGKTAEQLLNTPGEKMAEQLRLRLVTDATVTAIEPAARRVQTSAGTFEYKNLVLALGAAPVRLGLEGDGAAEVLMVNDLAGYARFRERLEGRKKVVVLGAGLVGCEFANDLLVAGYAVEVVDLAPLPMPGLLPAAIGQALADGLAGRGVGWHFGRRAVRVDRNQDSVAQAGYAVALDDGKVLRADLVLSAIGLRPHTQLAAQAGLKVDRGIVVDAFLRSSEPGIYALGDCAQYQSGVMPYVAPIVNAGRALAATLAEKPTAIAFPPMPVLVKTTILPIVVCPPPIGTTGDWAHHGEAKEDGLGMVFKSGPDGFHGFVLCGSRTAERAGMLKLLAQAASA